MFKDFIIMVALFLQNLVYLLMFPIFIVLILAFFAILVGPKDG